MLGEHGIQGQIFGDEAGKKVSKGLIMKNSFIRL